MEMAAPPGQCMALQAFNMVKEAISGYDNPFQKMSKELRHGRSFFHLHGCHTAH